jgi:hypothetical protein
MPLRFYIIYTRGTARALSFLLNSLLRWSDCGFCLVANGCDESEVAQLQQLCVGNRRLSFIALPSAGILPHGAALNYLQQHCADKYFCFMDSDIYANAPFMDDFTPNLDTYAGIFSGAALDHPPAGLRLTPGQRDLAGCFSHTASGLCLGSTYFAIYDQARLKQTQNDTGFGWEKRRWHEIPETYQQKLDTEGLRFHSYEPGKLTNLWLQWSGARLLYQPCAALRHLGGVSRFLSVRSWSWGLRAKVRAKLFLQGEFASLMRHNFTAPVRYYGEVLLALQEGRPLPAPEQMDAETAAQVMVVTRELQALRSSTP